MNNHGYISFRLHLGLKRCLVNFIIKSPNWYFAGPTITLLPLCVRLSFLSYNCYLWTCCARKWLDTHCPGPGPGPGPSKEWVYVVLVVVCPDEKLLNVYVFGCVPAPFLPGCPLGTFRYYSTKLRFQSPIARAPNGNFHLQYIYTQLKRISGTPWYPWHVVLTHFLNIIILLSRSILKVPENTATDTYPYFLFNTFQNIWSLPRPSTVKLGYVLVDR